MRGQLHALPALPPGKVPLVPIEYEAGWAPESVCTLWRRNKSLAIAGNQTPICWLSIAKPRDYTMPSSLAK